MIAHRPLGGVRRRGRTLKDPTLGALAERHDVTPFEIALAWLVDLSPGILPIPGATRVDSVRSLARIRRIAFTEQDRALLDEHFPSGRVLRTLAAGGPPQRIDGEVVLIMGLPGAGKSTLARSFVARGYERLNRDEAGGSLRQLLPALDRLLAAESDADRPRQHLRDPQVSKSGDPGGARARSANPVCLALDDGRRRPGQRRDPDGDEVRPPARAGGDAADGEEQIRTHSPRRSSSDISVSWSRRIRRRASREIDVVPFERSPRRLIHESRADCLVRWRAAPQPVRADGRRCPWTMPR